MKCSRDSQWIVGWCLLFFGFAGSAQAMATGESAYVWTSIDNGMFYIQNQHVVNSSFGL